MEFTKMHGLRNDYICINCFEQRVDDPRELARRVSNRHTGIGADGLILILPSEMADLRMEIYNADGSRAEMCGNGIRCVAKYAIDHGLAVGPELGIDTDAGVKRAVCHVVDDTIRSVRVDMGTPTLSAAAVPTTLAGCRTCPAGAGRVIDCPLSIAGSSYRVTCVSMGNPHAVMFVDDLDAVELGIVGPKFEHAPEFPQRVNAHFVRVESPNRVTMKSWERGSGATLACGTGACAVCVAGVITGRSERAITATLPGGDLELKWSDDDHVHMTGPAVEVFAGDWAD